MVGPDARRMAEELEPGEILVLENTRWEPGEKKNDPELAGELAALADVYVNDAFGSAPPGSRLHRRSGRAAAFGGRAAAGARGAGADGRWSRLPSARSWWCSAGRR